MTLTEECKYIIELGRYSFEVNDNLCQVADSRFPYWDQPRLIEFL